MIKAKEVRPRIKPELSTSDRFIESAAWMVLILMWIIVLINYRDLPEAIPSHFNTAGQPDDSGSKEFIFILPVIGTFVFLLLTVLQGFPYAFNYPVKITEKNALAQYTNALRMIRYLKLIILGIFSLITIFTISTAEGLSTGLGIWFVPFFMIAVFVPLVYFIVKAFKNK